MIKNIIGVVIFLAALGTLCALGTWQLQRAEWKKNIITQLETEYAKDPMKYRLEFDDLKNTAIQSGNIRGQFNYDKQILVGPKKIEDDIGYDVLIPMELTKGGHVLVNMGWVKGEKREEIKTPSPRGYIVVRGISRKPEWNSFTPNNSPANNVWTKLDIDQIAKAKTLEKVAPVIFYAKSASLTLKEFKMLEDGWFPRNKHMQYALFWFSMAGVLIIIFGLYIYKKKTKN